MGARWYDPGSGDFTSADTVQVSPDPDPAAGNPFAYAADDPLTGTDPTGHQPIPDAYTASARQGLKPVTTAAGQGRPAGASRRQRRRRQGRAPPRTPRTWPTWPTWPWSPRAPVVAKAAAKIPTYCAGNNIGALGTCMSAVYRAAGGAVDASGVPTTKGSSYNPKVASAAMAVVQKQYNAVKDATQKRDAAQQQADARQQAATARPAAPAAGYAAGCSRGRRSGCGALPERGRRRSGPPPPRSSPSVIGGGLGSSMRSPGLGEIAGALGLGGARPPPCRRAPRVAPPPRNRGRRRRRRRPVSWHAPGQNQADPLGGTASPPAPWSCSPPARPSPSASSSPATRSSPPTPRPARTSPRPSPPSWSTMTPTSTTSPSRPATAPRSSTPPATTCSGILH